MLLDVQFKAKLNYETLKTKHFQFLTNVIIQQEVSIVSAKYYFSSETLLEKRFYGEKSRSKKIELRVYQSLLSVCQTHSRCISF